MYCFSTVTVHTRSWMFIFNCHCLNPMSLQTVPDMGCCNTKSPVINDCKFYSAYGQWQWWKMFQHTVNIMCNCACRHAQDVRELYERKLERANNLYMELCACMLQMEKRERELAKSVSVTHLLTHTFLHHSLTHSFIHSFIHLFIVICVQQSVWCVYLCVLTTSELTHARTHAHTTVLRLSWILSGWAGTRKVKPGR